ncbi:hypothetical protein CPB85DRAFT_1479012 [Mucidula mucida]|nr:hypothetical protein CPB85DRAFT_1479012 [Mucidula mucida]
MSPNARVWKVYLDECRKFDVCRFEEWRDGLDVLVVFSGLFSIVVAIFCSQTFQRLRPDHNSMTSALLAEMVEIERAIADGTPVEEIAHTITDFAPKTSDLWVNGLCFSSLGVSIFIAVVAMLAKQWLRQYMAIPQEMPATVFASGTSVTRRSRNGVFLRSLLSCLFSCTSRWACSLLA